jgi:hypothetical protein
VLCAAHCFDEDADGQLESLVGPLEISDAVMFETTSGLVAINYQIDSVQVPGDWPELPADIAVITLNEDAPAELPRYRLSGRLDAMGHAAVLTGYGQTGHGSTGATFLFDPVPTKRAGLNRIEAVLEEPGIGSLLSADFDSGLPENNSHAFVGIESDLGFGPDEVGLALGDSGGPMFINGAIVGVNGITALPFMGDVNDEADFSWGEGSLFVRVAYYRDFILTATGGTAIFVPEPSTLALLILGTLAIHRAANNRC